MAGNRRWTEAELFKLEMMHDAGKPIKAIAKALDRSHDAVAAQLNKSGILTSSRYASYLTINEFARRMGVSANTVLSWAKWDLIAIQYYKVSLIRRVARISWDIIWAFLANEQTWMVWSVERITDADIKAYAKERRDNQAWEWLSTAMAAQRLGYSKDVVRTWAWRGVIPSVLVMRERFIDSRVLDSFVAPSEK